MARQRKIRDSGFKARVALDALKEREMVGQLAKRHGVHPTQIHEWKRRLQDQASSVFDRGASPRFCMSPGCPSFILGTLQSGLIESI